MRTALCLLLVLAAAVTGTPARCRRCPLCDHSTRWVAPWQCYMQTSLSPALIPQAARCLEGFLLNHLHGQGGIAQRLTTLVRAKLVTPEKRLVLHLAGDNGVGKTLTAEFISLATSMRCAAQSGTPCSRGDNMLVVSLPNYNGVATVDARRSIVAAVTAHLRRFPAGVVLLDDAQDAPAELLETLGPLFGHGDRFVEAPTVPLHLATVVVTSDMGKEGRTRGKTVEELERMIRQEMQAIYRYATTKHFHTLPYLPFGTAATRSLADHLIADLACRRGANVRDVRYEPMAVDVLLRELNDGELVYNGNGRAIAEAVSSELDLKLDSYLAEHGVNTMVDVDLVQNGDGALRLRIAPVDGLTAVEEL